MSGFEEDAFLRSAGSQRMFFLRSAMGGPTELKKMESKLDIFTDIAYTMNGKRTFHERRNTLKNRLEELRKSRGIRQEELAEALEVSRQTIGSLENGRYNPSILLAFKIAKYFDMSIEDIFIYEEEE